MPSIRRKLLYLVLAAAVPLVLALAGAVSTLAFLMWRDSMTSIESRTTMLHEAVDSTLRESIVGYLRAKTETALSTILMIDAMASYDDDSVLDLVGRYLLSTTVAGSGYIYVIDVDGRVVFHPDPGTKGRVIPEVEPIRTQREMRSGYIEYTWQNSFEPLPLPKALHMVEYPARGWIVSATAYREEFVDLIDRERLARLVGAYAVNGTSYSIVVNREGELIVHLDYPGRNIAEFFDPPETARVMGILFSEPAGQVRYLWPDAVTGERRPKLLVFRYMPDFDWAIATTIDLGTVRRPILLLGVSAGLLVLGILIVIIVGTLRMSRSVSGPVTRLAEAVEAGRRADIVEFGLTVPRELRMLEDRFNGFIDRIDQQQTGLQRSVAEKTALLRELHHRVKNNLQVVASLLNLQSGDVADPRDATLFTRSRDRVLSMALIHEQLYQTEDLYVIPFDRYLTDLIRHIQGSLRTEQISVEFTGQPISLSIDVAIPCGMIVNELVSNACEHAFDGNDAGTVRVTMTTNEKRHVLEVADSGNGMPDDPRQSLGMTLVRLLAEQIGGTVDISVRDGTTFRIEFPAHIST